VITLFSIPKPFAGELATIQRNALRSWMALEAAQVVLVGDEPGTAEAAAELGATHVTNLLTSPAGTPRVDDAVARVDAIAGHTLRCFVNADVILLDDFMPAVRRAQEVASSFLMVGSTVDLSIDEDLELGDVSVRADLGARARREGVSRGATAIDYFAFTAGLFDPIPPFVVGRARFDNWLVWRARERGLVLDASRAVLAVHQHHDYSHIPGGFREAHFGEEADRNLELAGGKRHLYTINDASHRLLADGRIRRNLGSTGRVRENARKIAWKLSLHDR
jgi:hypothetical protein